MEIREFKSLKKIEENDFNLSQAAKQLYVSQPALSKLIKNIEDTLGVDIFIRSKGKIIGFTAMGQTINVYGKQILGLSNDLSEAIQNQLLNISSSIKIGVCTEILYLIFANAIKQFISDYPNINLEIIEAPTLKLEKLLFNEELDLIIAPMNQMEINEEIYHFDHLITDNYVAIMDTNNELAEIDCLNWDKLEYAKIGIPNKNYISYTLIKDKFKKNNIEENINIYTYSTPELLTSSVIKTGNIAIIPRPLLPKEFLDKIVYKDFIDPLIWNLLIVRRNNINSKKTINMFIDYISLKCKIKLDTFK